MNQPVPVQIEGHAIVSADGMIADADGQMPPPLRNDADWQQFQAALDQAALVVLGREGHHKYPNPGRRRLVLTSRVKGLVLDPDDRLSHFWNPDGMTFAQVLAQLDIASGTIAVTGGTRVFDHFLSVGYDAFSLAMVRGYRCPHGRPAFHAGEPQAMLAAHGLVATSSHLIDESAGVTLTRWQFVLKSQS